MAKLHLKSMKKRIIVCFFFLLLLNFSLEFSINCNSLPKSQDDTRKWTLLNNENNSIVFELEESRNVTIQYYIEEIEEIDQMRYIVNLNFTGDTLQLYGNISEDVVKNYTIFYESVFAGDETNFYYELKLLNETIFTIPDYFYNFSWNFTTPDPLEFLNLRFHRTLEVTHPTYASWGSKYFSLIKDSPVFTIDNFENINGKIYFNINSQQFITIFNISVDFSKENHSTLNLAHNEVNYGDDSVAGTRLSGYLFYMNREESIIDAGWIKVISYSYSSIYLIHIPYTEVFGVNHPNSSSFSSNDEILNQTDELILSLYITPELKVDSPIYIFNYVNSNLNELISFELDNLSSSKEFFQKYSKIFIFIFVILGISGLVILTRAFLRIEDLKAKLLKMKS